MPDAPLVSVEEYLRRTSKPNCDYIDGVMRPKPWPDRAHGVVQGKLGSLLMQFRDFQPCIELTCKMRDTMYLVPDLAVMRKERIQDPYPTEPVHLCIEILSREDRFSAILRKCEHYLDWGVDAAWIVDPESLRAWEYRRGHRPTEVPIAGCLTAEGISIRMADVFSVL